MQNQITRAKARRQQGARAFGRMLRLWRLSNDWTQYIGEAWSKAAGFDCLSHGGLSPLEAGTVMHPRWGLFAHLAEMNRRLLRQDFTGVHGRQLLDKLKGAKPMIDDDGEILEEERLAGIHMGIRRVPAAYWVPEPSNEPLPAPELSIAEAAALCEAWRALVRDEALRRGQGLVASIDSMSQLVPANHFHLLQNVLVGGTYYSPDQLQALWSDDHWLPDSWVQTWIEGPKRLSPAGGGGGALGSNPDQAVN